MLKIITTFKRQLLVVIFLFYSMGSSHAWVHGSSFFIDCPGGAPSVDANGWTVLNPRPPTSDGVSNISTTGLKFVTVTNHGVGYSSTPNIGFVGGGGSGAAAHAVMSGQFVDSIVIDNPGSGYTSNPSVTFTGGTPSIAAAASAYGGVDGTNLLYVSTSGTDVSTPGSCSQAAPCKTLSFVRGIMRQGRGDWMLLKRGDTWTNETFGQAIAGYSCLYPTVYSNYGSGDRPIIDLDPADALGASFFTATGGVQTAGDFTAVVGLKLMRSTIDPDNVAFNATTAYTKVWIGFNFLNAIRYMLIEDNDIGFSAITPNALYATNQLYSGGKNIIIRRNAVYGYYQNANLAHAACIGGDQAINLLIEENVIDMCGWNKPLTDPAVVTISVGSPVVITWTGQRLQNNALVYFCTTGALPAGMTGIVNCSSSNYTASTTYCVFNLGTPGTDQFNIYLPTGSSCPGGSPTLINTTSCSGSCSTSTQTARYGNFMKTIFNHGIYFNAAPDSAPNVAGPMIVRYNIITRSADTACQCRSGGNFDTNLLSENPVGPSGVSSSSYYFNIRNNVITQGTNVDQVGGNLGVGWGFVPNFAIIGTWSGNIIANTEVSASGGQQGINAASLTANIQVTGNITCNWGGGFQNSGTNNTFSGNNYATGIRTYAQTDCSGLGYPNPTISIGDYNQSLGNINSLTDFIDRAKQNNKANWNTSYTALPAINYIRVNGFSLPPVN